MQTEAKEPSFFKDQVGRRCDDIRQICCAFEEGGEITYVKVYAKDVLEIHR